VVTEIVAISEEPVAPSLPEATRFWFRLGWISFGGTAAHIAIMHEWLVERQQWIDHEVFFHALGHCMILPGPEAQQLAIYLGWKLHGVKGGLVAGTLFVLPSMFVLLALSVVYTRFGSLPWIAAMFSGLRPAVLALVLLALVRLAKRSLTGWMQWVVAIGGFAAMAWLHVSVPIVMAVAIALGMGLARYGPGADAQQKPPAGAGVQSSSDSGPDTKGTFWRAGKIAAAGLAIWLTPLLLLRMFGRDFSFWAQLGLFFTRTAFVTVGGSYTVIPYVAQAAVFHYHWLSQREMLDGFALAETTPGPLIIVVAFVGFLAGFHHFHGSAMMGTVALLLTTLYTFLPCFLFVLAGTPFVAWTQRSESVRTVLALVVAVVLAAMAELA
jgi:chromate transporter